MNGKVVGAVAGGVVALLVIGFMGGALLNKPDESAYQTAQSEFKKTLKERNEELERKEKAHLEEIANLNKLHNETVARLKSEIATKDTVITRQGKIIISRSALLWGTLVGGGLLFVSGIVLSAIVGAGFRKATRNDRENNVAEEVVTV